MSSIRSAQILLPLFYRNSLEEEIVLSLRCASGRSHLGIPTRRNTRKLRCPGFPRFHCLLTFESLVRLDARGHLRCTLRDGWSGGSRQAIIQLSGIQTCSRSGLRECSSCSCELAFTIFSEVNLTTANLRPVWLIAMRKLIECALHP
jgi:hypothetical protein